MNTHQYSLNIHLKEELTGLSFESCQVSHIPTGRVERRW